MLSDFDMVKIEVETASYSVYQDDCNEDIEYFGLQEIRIIPPICRDTDDDGIIDSHDIDSDNDQFTDADEAYVDINADGNDNPQYGLGVNMTHSNGLISEVGTVLSSDYEYVNVEAVTNNVAINSIRTPISVTTCFHETAVFDNAYFQGVSYTQFLDGRRSPNIGVIDITSKLKYKWLFSDDAGKNYREMPHNSTANTLSLQVKPTDPEFVDGAYFNLHVYYEHYLAEVEFVVKLEIDYNDSSKMMRIKEDPLNACMSKTSDYATYYQDI